MKFIFTSLFVLCTCIGALGNNLPVTDTVSICGHKLTISDELKLTAPQEISGDGYSVTWQYITAKELEKMPAKTIASLNKKLKNVSDLELECYFLHEPVTRAHGFTYDNEAGARVAEIIIFSSINNQPVYAQIKLSTTVFENEQLPLFINRILVLSR